jgi:hypothetical protein
MSRYGEDFQQEWNIVLKDLEKNIEKIRAEYNITVNNTER